MRIFIEIIFKPPKIHLRRALALRWPYIVCISCKWEMDACVGCMPWRSPLASLEWVFIGPYCKLIMFFIVWIGLVIFVTFLRRIQRSTSILDAPFTVRYGEDSISFTWVPIYIYVGIFLHSFGTYLKYFFWERLSVLDHRPYVGIHVYTLLGGALPSSLFSNILEARNDT